MKKRTRNSKNKNKDLSTIVLLLIVVVVGMSIAYAALSASLEVRVNKITQNAITWNVAFDTSGSPVAGTSSGSSTTGLSCGNATVTANSVTVADTQLSKPDDTCTYALTIKNTGGIDAKLGTITPINPGSTSCTSSGASMVCGNITYKLATNSAGSTLLAVNSTIVKSTGTQPVYLVLKYTGTEPSNSSVVQSNGGFTLTYNQA